MNSLVTEAGPAQRWTRRPQGSNWGEFGPDDQWGRLNLLTAEKVRQGLDSVEEDLTFCLSLPLDVPGGSVLNPSRSAPEHRPTLRGSVPNRNRRVSGVTPGATDVVNDDSVTLCTHYSTHWDALSHVGQMFDADGDGEPEPVFYNGFRAGPDIGGMAESARADDGRIGYSTGIAASRLGIERMAERCIQGRAVMIDLRAHLGDGRTLVGYDHLMEVIAADRVEVEPGDIVCLHTGFAQVLLDNPRPPSRELADTACAVLDGRDARLLDWITRSGLAALAADNYAVEAAPATMRDPCCATLPLHEHCLFKLGIHLGELWHLTPLADHLRQRRRSRFLLTAPPLRLPGAVGSPTTPIATV